MEAPTLSGTRATLRASRPGDAEALLAILIQPEVARWWPLYDDIERVHRDLIDELPHEARYVIEHGGQAVGYIQSLEEDEPDFRHASIDLFLAAEARGQGLGPDAIRLLASDLIDRCGHHRLTIDPAADNASAIAAYRKVGFRAVGIMRAYQRMPDGMWVNALLMEMLAEELIR